VHLIDEGEARCPRSRASLDSLGNFGTPMWTSAYANWPQHIVSFSLFTEVWLIDHGSGLTTRYFLFDPARLHGPNGSEPP